MKIKSIKANVHRIFAEVPLIDHPLSRRIVFCEVETDEGHVGYGLTGGGFLPWSVVTALTKEFLPVVKDMDPRDTEAIHEKVWWKMNQRTMTGVDIERALLSRHRVLGHPRQGRRTQHRATARRRARLGADVLHVRLSRNTTARRSCRPRKTASPKATSA